MMLIMIGEADGSFRSIGMKYGHKIRSFKLQKDNIE